MLPVPSRVSVESEATVLEILAAIVEPDVRASEKTVSLKPAMLNRLASVTLLPPSDSDEVSGITLLFPSSRVPRKTLVEPA